MANLSTLFEEFKASRLKYPQQRRGAEDAFFGGLVDAISKLEPAAVRDADSTIRQTAPVRYPAGYPERLLDSPAPRAYPESARQGIMTSPAMTNPAAAQSIMQEPKRRGRPPKVRGEAPSAAPVKEEPNG